MKIQILTYLCTFIFFSTSINSQSLLNFTPSKIIIKEHRDLKNNEESINNFPLSLSYINSFYNNSNLPNLENQNGNYFPKGYGIFSSLLIKYKTTLFTLTTEPNIIKRKKYQIFIPQKQNEFSVLNDVPKEKIFNQNYFRNTGIKLTIYGFSAGFGNWNQWWGPGIHNSLSLSNNTEGFYHYFIGTDKFQPFGKYLYFNFKYLVSNSMQNLYGEDFYLSSWFLNLKNNFLEFGIMRNVLSGGYSEILWKKEDAFNVLIDNKNIKYWDTLNTFYILVNFKESGLKVFYEFGFPNRTYGGKDPEAYSDHAMGTNIGLRKHGLFGKSEILFGFEYTRLLQGIYYNILPTPNWYDNIKYNYSSFKGRRWAAHSGSDSDDFLLFVGYINSKLSLIYGVNYERHGVTYHFPPEVKFESRVSFSYKYDKTKIFINYENEYFEHYGFVDSNSNVWAQNYESGSIQRTNTLLISIEYNFTLNH